jgi:hypothetical protein
VVVHALGQVDSQKAGSVVLVLLEVVVGYNRVYDCAYVHHASHDPSALDGCTTPSRVASVPNPTSVSQEDSIR